MTDPRRCLSVLRVFSSNSPALIALGAFGAMGLGLVNAPVLARALEPSDRGVLGSVVAAMAILPVLAGLGIPTESRRASSRGLSLPHVRAGRDLMALSLVPTVLLTVICMCTVFSSLGRTQKVFVAVALMCAPVAAWGASDTGALVGSGRFREVFFVRIVGGSVGLEWNLTGLAFGRVTFEYAVLSNVMATVCTAGLAAWYLKVPLRGPRASRRLVLRSGLSFFGASVAEIASNRLDQVVMLPIVGAAQSGIYAVAVSIGYAPLAIGQALGAAALREVSRAPGDTQRDAAAKAIESSCAVTLVFAGMLACIVPFAVPWLFGSEYLGAVLPTILLLVGSIAMSTGYVASMTLVAVSRGWWMTGAQVVGVVSDIALLAVLGGFFGAVGVAGASLLSSFALLAVLLAGWGLPFWHLRVTPRRLLDGLAVLVRRAEH